jgi:general secretion pathway protein D
MQHVMKWVRDLDQPGQTVNTQGVFYYQVQNTSAKELAEVLARIMGGGGPEPESNRQQQQQIGAGPAGASVPQANQTSQANSPTPSALIGNRRVTIDAARNAIIFQGTPEEFSQFRTLAVQMDRAPLEVLIEATIAEVTLTDNEDLGVTLTYDNGVNPVLNSSSVKSNEGLFVSLIRDRGAFLSNLTASANKNKVTILSSPRVVASSGKKANIKVGTQVPILTTQQTAATGAVNGTSTILQDVQYRDTGVLLTIDPVINSNRRVELDISQEVSEAGANKISDVASPTIFTRDIQTSLSLSDGETVLLGGLISENLSKGDNGIPFLKDVPVLGNLFKTTSKGRTRIELVVLLTPYIIDGTDTARAVRDAFVNELPSLPPIPMSTPLPQKH